jgi:molecular chaperone GrpE
MSKKKDRKEEENEELKVAPETDGAGGGSGTDKNEDSVADGNENPCSELRSEIDSLNDKYLRLYSEFENFRRRTAKERLDMMKTAGEDVFKLLLPIIDDFERARTNMETAADVPSVKEGVELIYHKMVTELQHKGLKPMAAKGEVFDPEIHEAITQIPAPTEELKGKVVDEIEKGYYLNDKVIRYAKVVVGS